MIAFFTKCLETARKETRSLELTHPHGSLPAGTYSFVEFYRANLKYNCQRVTPCVYPSTDLKMRNRLAQIGFGWESPAFYAKWLRDAALGREAAGVSLLRPPNNKNARFFMAALKKDLADNP